VQITPATSDKQTLLPSEPSATTDKGTATPQQETSVQSPREEKEESKSEDLGIQLVGLSPGQKQKLQREIQQIQESSTRSEKLCRAHALARKYPLLWHRYLIEEIMLSNIDEFGLFSEVEKEELFAQFADWLVREFGE
jgi:hypothetical protein